MKIAFIYDGAYPWIKGGVEKRVYEIGRRLAERGHEVHWYCVGWWLDEEDDKDIEVDGIKYHGVCEPLQMYVNGRRSIKAAIKFSMNLLRPLLKEKFDLIDCQNFPYFSCFPAKLASIIKSTPLIVTWHEFWGDYWYIYLGSKGFFGKIIEKFVSGLADYNLAVSKKTAQDLENKNINVLNVIPNGIDVESIKSTKPSQLSSDVIFAGRIIEHKNVDVLIEAIHILKDEVPDIKCLIIGDGPEKPRCKNMVEKLDLQDNIKFLPFVEDEELIGYMKSSKVFVLPSTREGFGMVALEANAAGLPVITVEHPDNATENLIKRHGGGHICTLSSHEIAEKIKEAIQENNPPRNYSKEYDWNKIVSNLENFYRGVS